MPYDSFCVWVIKSQMFLRKYSTHLTYLIAPRPMDGLSCKQTWHSTNNWGRFIWLIYMIRNDVYCTLSPNLLWLHSYCKNLIVQALQGGRNCSITNSCQWLDHRHNWWSCQLFNILLVIIEASHLWLNPVSAALLWCSVPGNATQYKQVLFIFAESRSSSFLMRMLTLSKFSSLWAPMNVEYSTIVFIIC